MNTKFKLSPNQHAEPQPATAEEFANAAGMVRSQQAERPLKPVRLNLDLTPSFHERLKLRAAELRLTGAQYIRELVLKDLRESILK
ncbi:hypothetical protein [Paraburkholderia dinghuensis]|uniref:Uncharacterized protein n=1 Tax=Paraburkholderia dinghuensis TaxID=2305225 RepID=A0A3N6M8Z7_9BURK|nr:hypothetical protein [Paraburkholderia dinghuensis]RQH00194.1 hypothetical protein D1Y85_25495 [Paraburkholderia dinghuensis]